MIKNSLTILTTFKNDWDDLKKTIISIKSQSFTNWNHIIIDASTTIGQDNSFFEEYKKDKRVNWILKKNMSQYEAYNLAISYVNYGFFQILNSGTTYYNDELLSDFFGLKLDCDMVFFNSQIIENKKKYILKPKMNALPYKSQHEGIFYSNKKITHLTNFSIEADIIFVTSHISEPKIKIKFIDKVLINYPRGGMSDIRGIKFERVKNILISVLFMIKKRKFYSALFYFLRAMKDIFIITTRKFSLFAK